MPLSEFNFKPHPEIMSFGKLFTHIGSSLNGYGEVLGGSASADEPDPIHRTEVYDYLQHAFNHFNYALDNANRDDLYKIKHAKADTDPWRDFTIFDIITLGYNHTIHHIAQATVFIRLNNIMPPKYRFWIPSQTGKGKARICVQGKKEYKNETRSSLTGILPGHVCDWAGALRTPHRINWGEDQKRTFCSSPLTCPFIPALPDHKNCLWRSAAEQDSVADSGRCGRAEKSLGDQVAAVGGVKRAVCSEHEVLTHIKFVTVWLV